MSIQNILSLLLKFVLDKGYTSRNLLDILADEVIAEKVGLDIEAVKEIRRKSSV